MRSHDNNLQSTKNFERIQKQKRQKKIKIILLLPRPHPHPVADIVPPRGDQGLLQHLSKWQWAQGPPISPWAPRLHPIHPPTAPRSLRPHSLTFWHPQGVSRPSLDADTPNIFPYPPEPCSRGVQDWGPPVPSLRAALALWDAGRALWDRSTPSQRAKLPPEQGAGSCPQ